MWNKFSQAITFSLVFLLWICCKVHCNFNVHSFLAWPLSLLNIINIFCYLYLYLLFIYFFLWYFTKAKVISKTKDLIHILSKILKSMLVQEYIKFNILSQNIQWFKTEHATNNFDDNFLLWTMSFQDMGNYSSPQLPVFGCSK